MTHLLDSEQLRTFVAIADTRSFTRAGERVHKTQSAVSMQMKRLEERIGRSLFTRDGRGVRLSRDGERLLEFARRIVRLNAECLASFDEAALSGRVRLGVPDDYAERYLPEILARFSTTHPRAEVEVICEPSEMLVARVRAGDLDLAIITDADDKGPVEVIRIEPLLWVTSARHAVHEERPLPLALGRATCAWRTTALARLEEAGTPSRILYVSWNSSAVGAAVQAGLAVSVLPESALRPGMRVLGPSDGFPKLAGYRIALMRIGEPTALAAALADEIRDSLDNLGAPALAAQ